jgi:hypothetical protein
LCANCERPLDAVPTIQLYCSDYCREWAKHVRYFRATEADGRASRDPLVAEALRTRMAFILGGGYHARARILSQEARLHVLARNGGVCVGCNERPAVEVDHVDGDSPDPSNLQGLCHPCHQVKTESRYVPLEAQDRLVRGEFLSQVHEDEPLMAAHTPEWGTQWRRYDRLNRDWALKRCSEPVGWNVVDGRLVEDEAH